ncbi:MAG: hypothetical protein ABMA26_07210 [Limisphaerales bacterium]
MDDLILTARITNREAHSAGTEHMDITCPLCGQPTPTPTDILATRATCVRCGQSFALDALPTMVPAAAPTPDFGIARLVELAKAA